MSPKLIPATLIALLLCSPRWATGDASKEAIERSIAPVLQNVPVDGLLIFQVVPDSQSASAGFKVGDILTHYDGQPVASTRELSQLARAVAQEKRKALVIVNRDGKELEAEFDAAPLGVRITPVAQGESRTLWRPGTQYEPNAEPLRRRLSEGHRFELFQRDDQILGWSHHFLTRNGDRLVLRAQSRLTGGHLDVKRDVVISFVPDRFLSPRSIRVTSKDQLILELSYRGQSLSGSRVGVPVSAPLPVDTVSSYLGGLVATTLPAEKGACLRSSYLEASSLVAAPFADLCCLGEDALNVDGQPLNTYRYEQTVFGKRVIHYWIDGTGDVVQTLYGNGIRSVRSTREQVLQVFKDMENEFTPIEQLPPLEPPAGVQAN